MEKNSGMKLMALAVVATLSVIGVAYATGYWTGSVGSGSITVTSTIAPASLAITAATEGGEECDIVGTTATCGGATIGQGGTLAIVVTVTNSGGTAATVGATCTAPALGDATCTRTSGTASQSVAATTGTATWTFTYAAGQDIGPDSVSISLETT